MLIDWLHYKCHCEACSWCIYFLCLKFVTLSSVILLFLLIQCWCKFQKPDLIYSSFLIMQSCINHNGHYLSEFLHWEVIVYGFYGHYWILKFSFWFQVNASGQFVGLAEMIGPVDFNKNLDFWQKETWNGFFPVKWHIIKDIPNRLFQSIRLENNDNKAVTFSKDTQEVSFSLSCLKSTISICFKNLSESVNW